MDWMEKVFGLSPDGGDGTFELAVALGLATIAAIVAVVWLRKARGGFGRPAA